MEQRLWHEGVLIVQACAYLLAARAAFDSRACMSDTEGRLGRTGMNTGVACKDFTSIHAYRVIEALVVTSNRRLLSVGIVPGFSLQKKDRRLTAI